MLSIVFFNSSSNIARLFVDYVTANNMIYIGMGYLGAVQCHALVRLGLVALGAAEAYNTDPKGVGSETLYDARARIILAQRGLVALVVLLIAGNLSAQTPAEIQAGQHFQAARQAEKDKDFQKAASEYRETLKLKPEVAEIWFNMGLDLYLLERNDEAIDAFQQALKRKPGLPGANLFLGMACLRSNRYETAIPPLKKAIAQNPQELRAYTNLSVAYLELGREEEAASVLLKAKEHFPHSTEVLYSLGRTYTKLMEKSYKEMVQVDPDSYRFHQVLGESYQLRRDYPHATEDYLKALEKSPDPNIPGLHYSLGSCYWMEAKWDLAIEQFKQELAISPENYLATWKLGDTYLFQRNYDEARTYLARALQQKPGLGQANRDMGKLCLQTNQPDDALVYLKKVVQSDPEEPSVHYLMAQSYRKMGKQTEMKAELEMFQKLRTQESERGAKHADTSALGGVESPNERPRETETLDDLQ
jgi:tetratricopeptide (TPR) repeat protein